MNRGIDTKIHLFYRLVRSFYIKFQNRNFVSPLKSILFQISELSFIWGLIKAINFWAIIYHKSVFLLANYELVFAAELIKGSNRPFRNLIIQSLGPSYQNSLESSYLQSILNIILLTAQDFTWIRRLEFTSQLLQSTWWITRFNWTEGPIGFRQIAFKFFCSSF